MRLVYILLAMIVIMNMLVVVNVAGPAQVTVTKLPEVKAPAEFQIELFCREDETQKDRVVDLAKKGFQYVGVLNANGINCNQVLFGK